MNNISLSNINNIQKLKYNSKIIFNEKDLHYFKKIIVNNDNNILIKLNNSINNFISYNKLNYCGLLKLFFLIRETLYNNIIHESCAYGVNLFSIVYMIINYIMNTNTIYITIIEKELLENYIYDSIINFDLSYSNNINSNSNSNFIENNEIHNCCCNFLFV
jgi:hypothetical protein